MSWSGFKKNANRATTKVMMKTGHVEKTNDRDYETELRSVDALSYIPSPDDSPVRNYERAESSLSLLHPTSPSSDDGAGTERSSPGTDPEVGPFEDFPEYNDSDFGSGSSIESDDSDDEPRRPRLFTGGILASTLDLHPRKLSVPGDWEDLPDYESSSSSSSEDDTVNDGDDEDGSSDEDNRPHTPYRYKPGSFSLIRRHSSSSPIFPTPPRPPRFAYLHPDASVSAAARDSLRARYSSVSPDSSFEFPFTHLFALAEIDTDRRFRTMETAANKLQNEAKGYLDALRAMTASQMRIAETIDAFYGEAGTRDGVSRSYKQAVTDLDAETIKALDGPYRTAVLEPISRFCAYFPDINACITKREHKLLDYDSLRSKVAKLTNKPDKDVTKLPRVEKETEQARQAYDDLNEKLCQELPQILELRVPYLDPSFEALVKIQLRFCAEAYARMAQVQQYLDKDTRDQYADGVLDARVEEVLEEIRGLSIAGTV